MRYNEYGEPLEYLPFTDYGKLPEDEREMYFYTAAPIKKEVSKEEFDEFLRNYPRPLKKKYGHHSSEVWVYFDDELSDYWRFSEVAIRRYDWLYLENPIDDYEIVVNHEELYDTRTGNNETFKKQIEVCFKERTNFDEYNHMTCPTCNVTYKMVGYDEFDNTLYECPICHRKIWHH